MKEYLIVFTHFNLDYIYNKTIVAPNKKEAIDKLMRIHSGIVIINIILLTEDSDITE